MGIDFIDTIVVRRSTERGTKTINTPVRPVNFMGEEHKKQDAERLKLAGDLWIMSAKGTKRIKLSDMYTPKATLPKGYYISTGKGTGRIRI